MGKYFGKVGFSLTVETSPGVWQKRIIENRYKGDVLEYNIKWEGSDQLNNDLTISQRISIVADPFAYKNYGAIRYVEWNGIKWAVKSVKVTSPRIVLTVGGVYNGQ